MLARDARERWEESAERIRGDSRFSPWLKQHLARALARPALEALEDAEILRAVLRGRLGTEWCGDPLADVPLAALDPLASAEPRELPARRADSPASAERLLREGAALLHDDRVGAALLFLDAERRIVARGVVSDDVREETLGQLFARALRQGARRVLLVQSVASGADSSVGTLMRKRVLEIASLLGVAVEDLARELG